IDSPGKVYPFQPLAYLARTPPLHRAKARLCRVRSEHPLSERIQGRLAESSRLEFFPGAAADPIQLLVSQQIGLDRHCHLLSKDVVSGGSEVNVLWKLKVRQSGRDDGVEVVDFRLRL